MLGFVRADQWSIIQQTHTYTRGSHKGKASAGGVEVQMLAVTIETNQRREYVAMLGDRVWVMARLAFLEMQMGLLLEEIE